MTTASSVYDLYFVFYITATKIHISVNMLGAMCFIHTDSHLIQKIHIPLLHQQNTGDCSHWMLVLQKLNCCITQVVTSYSTGNALLSTGIQKRKCIYIFYSGVSTHNGPAKLHQEQAMSGKCSFFRNIQFRTLWVSISSTECLCLVHMHMHMLCRGKSMSLWHLPSGDRTLLDTNGGHTILKCMVKISTISQLCLLFLDSWNKQISYFIEILKIILVLHKPLMQ